MTVMTAVLSLIFAGAAQAAVPAVGPGRALLAEDPVRSFQEMEKFPDVVARRRILTGPAKDLELRAPVGVQYLIYRVEQTGPWEKIQVRGIPFVDTDLFFVGERLIAVVIPEPMGMPWKVYRRKLTGGPECVSGFDIDLPDAAQTLQDWRFYEDLLRTYLDKLGVRGDADLLRKAEAPRA